MLSVTSLVLTPPLFPPGFAAPLLLYETGLISLTWMWGYVEVFVKGCSVPCAPEAELHGVCPGAASLSPSPATLRAVGCAGGFLQHHRPAVALALSHSTSVPPKTGSTSPAACIRVARGWASSLEEALASSCPALTGVGNFAP